MSRKSTAGKSLDQSRSPQAPTRTSAGKLHSGTPDAAVALQQAAGNRAMTGLLDESSGKPLDPGTRLEMERKFRTDFSDVRVHTGEVGADVALGAGARAITSGRDIAFSKGFYEPTRSEGRRLIAHELAHVVQQRGNGSRKVSAGSAEAEARQAAVDVTGGRAATVAASASGAQADPLKDEERRKQAESMLPTQLLDSIHTITTPTSPQADPQKQPDAAPPVPAPAAPGDFTTSPDFVNALKSGVPPQDPNKVHWLGNPATRPSWTQGMTYQKDARGNITIDSPELGRTTFAPSGKRLTPVPNGDAEKIKKSLRAMDYLQKNGGKRIVEGKAPLDEAGWKEHIAGRKQTLSEDVERKFVRLSEGVRLFHETQTGVATAAAVPAHVLGGRRMDDSQKIVSRARQDIEIAKHQMDMARTPEELAEAEHHLQFVVGNAEAQFTRYKEDVYEGGENTITGIKATAAVAVSAAALGTPALVAAGGTVTAGSIGVGAAGGGTLNTVRQIAQMHDGTRKDFSVGEVGWSMAGGAALGAVPGAGPLLMGPAVASSADEFSQGHLATGTVDALSAVAPIAMAKEVPSAGGPAKPSMMARAGQHTRPRVAAMMMRAGQGLEDVPGIGGTGSSPGVNLPHEVLATPRPAVVEPAAAPRPAIKAPAPPRTPAPPVVQDPVITPPTAAPPGGAPPVAATPAVSNAVVAPAPEVTPSVSDPVAPTPQAVSPSAKTPIPQVPFSPVPANVGDKAFKARAFRVIENAMRADPRNTIGAGGEAAWETRGVSPGINLNKVSRDFPVADYSSRNEAPASVKAYGLGKPVAASTLKRLDREFRRMVTPEEPGVPTKLGDAAARMAANRQAIQDSGAWPKGLAKNATPEQIAKFINREGILAVLHDQVEPLKAMITERARANPEAYGLKAGPGLEVGIQRLVERVQSMGVTSEELSDINKKVLGL